MKPLSPLIFGILLATLLALRLWHFGPEIDLPHDWRQSDTAYAIDVFYQNGIDLLHPSVCWMGPKDTVIFEFPLPEAIVALALKFTGYSLWAMRLVFMVFFGVVVGYFFASIRLVWGLEMAQVSTLVYVAMPLSLFYSRAIHIDFFELACAHAMFFYFLKSIREQSFKYLILSSLLAIPAFMVKAPYAVLLAFPMAVFAGKEQAWKWLLPRAAVFAVPVVAFWLWERHVYQVNAAAPDWGYILSYRKFDHNAHWYFGNWRQRLMPYHWKVLALRLTTEVAGPGGILLVIWGLINLKSLKMNALIWAWGLGLLIYLFVFFNLNVIHNYYQLPFLAVAAVLAGHGLVFLKNKKTGWYFAGLAFLVVGNVAWAETHYYQIPAEIVEIGTQIDANTPKNALVVVTYRDFDCRNPRILYRAHRRGWSIEQAALSKNTLEKLRQEGATHWAYIGPKLPAIEVSPVLILQEKRALDSDSLFIFEWKLP